MGAEQSAPMPPAYQPSFMDQHVRKAQQQVHCARDASPWQGQRYSMGADSYMITEVKRSHSPIAHMRADIPSTTAAATGIGESWLMVQAKKAGELISDVVVSKGMSTAAPPEAPSVPSDSWLSQQQKVWQSQRPAFC